MPKVDTAEYEKIAREMEGLLSVPGWARFEEEARRAIAEHFAKAEAALDRSTPSGAMLKAHSAARRALKRLIDWPMDQIRRGK